LRAVPRIGLQLYTIRDECERDLEHAIARVGELGYAGVELHSLYGRDARAVRALLDGAGLEAVALHAGLAALQAELPRLVDEAKALGTQRLVLAWIEPGEGALESIASAAAEVRAAGLAFGFHNHWLELEPQADGRTFLDALRTLPADELFFELDLGWIWHAGADPEAELARTSGRCPLVHVKDYANREGRDDVPVGDGIVGYEHVVPAAVRAGAEWLLVEEDEVGDRPFEALARSVAAVERYLAAS
jgi:sugar phosphate isomerase/epimerase